MIPPTLHGKLAAFVDEHHADQVAFLNTLLARVQTNRRAVA